MARFDVYRHPTVKRRGDVPYLLSIQAGALDFLATRIVVPLVDVNRFGARIPFLHPILEIEEREVVMATNELVAIENQFLGNPVTNLDHTSLTLVSALDYLISGY